MPRLHCGVPESVDGNGGCQFAPHQRAVFVVKCRALLERGFRHGGIDGKEDIGKADESQD